MIGRVAPEQRRTTGAAAPGQSAGERGTARIAVDLLGGDHAPAVVVDGALRACQADPALTLLLAGPTEVTGAVLAALDPAFHPRITAGDVSGADAFVSAGDTGGIVKNAILGLGRLPGVRRPALAAVLPTLAGRLVLLDVGSSVDPGADDLVMHARLGAAYAAVVHRVADPLVGLLTIGTEPGKGDRLRRAVPTLLGTEPLPAGARYAGLVEGHDVVLGGAADVVVTDGFTGNILLKGLETAYSLHAAPALRAGVPRAAVLLGVAGIVVVCHGAAAAGDVAAGIALAAQLHRQAAVPAMAALIPRHEVSS